MQRVDNIGPKVEHYGCMADLLGRAGLMRGCDEVVNEILWGVTLCVLDTFQGGTRRDKRLIKMEPGDMGP